MLLIHALPRAPGALDLNAIIEDQGLSQSVRFSDWYTYVTGQIQPPNLAVWYNCLDLLSNASHGEGFGLPIIESQACGTPPVVTDHSAMTELCGAGWMVGGEPFWNGQLAGITGHNAWWKTPYADEITAAYEAAYAEKVSGEADVRRKQAREFALAFDADVVLEKYWKPVLKELEEM
jgi:glycosyltransferase involved in cell wall biosynthesis